MKNKQNLHTHTTYVDGKDTPDELCREAILQGFDSIGFSEHSYLKYSSFPHQLTVADMQSYKSEIYGLKQKYKGELDVFCGLELDFYSERYLDGFDYIIGSVHYLDCGGGRIATFDWGLKETDTYIREYFGGDGMAFARKYYETVARLSENSAVDIIGHFDLVTKNNKKGGFFDTSDQYYLKLGYNAIDALCGKIPFFEVNTGAISRGYTDLPYPQTEFLKEFKNRGFGAVITSDCHDKKALDCSFEKARELLKAAGFNSRFILTDSGFKEVGI